MKMAKASKDDMVVALRLCSALEAIETGFLPRELGEDECFDYHNDVDCGRVLRHILDMMQHGSIGRVILGMHVLIHPETELVDPNADTLKLHPKLVAALAATQATTEVHKDITAELTQEHAAPGGS